MSETDRNLAKAHEQVATRNSRVAIQVATDTRESLEEQVKCLRGAVSNLQHEVSHLHQKYNLLLTKNFDGGSTSGD